MSEVQEQNRTQVQRAAEGGPVAVFQPPRLPYHKAIEDRFGVDAAGWRALVEAVWPLAKSSDAVVLALSYCKARKLDPFKKVVHIVPMWNSALGREVETVWPGIAEHRTTAFRTGQYAGADPTSFGPTVTKTFTARSKKGEALSATVTFPEWAQVTVYRMIAGQRVAFPGPRTLFDEWFGLRKGAEVPNDRWTRAPSQMLEKCAEAAALRKAFPEELGDESTAEESEGRMTDVTPAGPTDPAPPRPTRADFVKPEPEQEVEIDEAAEREADAMQRRAAEGEQVDGETGEVTDKKPEIHGVSENKSPQPPATPADPLTFTPVVGQPVVKKNVRDFYATFYREAVAAPDAEIGRMVATNRAGLALLDGSLKSGLYEVLAKKGWEGEF